MRALDRALLDVRAAAEPLTRGQADGGRTFGLLFVPLSAGLAIRTTARST